MATVLSFVCTTSDSGWKAKCCNNDEVADVEAADRWALEKLLKAETINRSSGGGMSCAFSWVTPKTAIYQFTVGGAVAVAVAAGGGGGATADTAPKAEEKKESEKEESEESGSEGMFGLFD